MKYFCGIVSLIAFYSPALQAQPASQQADARVFSQVYARAGLGLSNLSFLPTVQLGGAILHRSGWGAALRYYLLSAEADYPAGYTPGNGILDDPHRYNTTTVYALLLQRQFGKGRVYRCGIEAGPALVRLKEYRIVPGPGTGSGWFSFPSYDESIAFHNQPGCIVRPYVQFPFNRVCGMEAGIVALLTAGKSSCGFEICVDVGRMKGIGPAH